MSWDEFRSTILEEASRRDRRIWPLAGTMFLGGLSGGRGHADHAHPRERVGLGSGGLWCGHQRVRFREARRQRARESESLGRRPLVAGGLLMIASGYGAVWNSTRSGALSRSSAMARPSWLGRAARNRHRHAIERRRVDGVISTRAVGVTAFADSTLDLAGARALTGLGVAGLVTGSSMAAADLSTPLSRAATQAPLGASFNAGTIMGPAIGGGLAALVGPSATFAAVGGFVALDAIFARVMLSETRGVGSLEDGPPPPTDVATIVRRVKRSLQDSPELRRLCVANYAYWATLAGASMTVLPLVLATDLGGLQALGPGQIGALFAGQACISVVGAVPAASQSADKYGPATMIPPALLVYAAAFGALPFASAHSYEAVACAMALQACGSCLLGSAPSAAAVNAVPDKDRAAALAALRASAATSDY